MTHVRRIVLVLIVVVASGCGGSGEAERQTEAETAPTSTASKTTSSETQAETPPTSVDAFLATLPPFDVPVSPEVDAYRRASIGAFYEHCVSSKYGADEASFVRANVELLDEMPVFPGTELINEYSIDQRENTGCPEGLGPPTSYTTSRNYRLPAGTRGQDVAGYYERRLPDWAKAFASGHCEQTFTRGEALVAVSACGNSLSLRARAKEPTRLPPAQTLPPRPTGEQYPPTTEDYRGPTEPSGYEAEPGTTCERGEASGAQGVVPIILPPPPGVRARVEDKPFKLGAATFDHAVVVEWWFERILGDCPPTRLQLTLANPNPGMPPLSLPHEVHARSGKARLPVLDSFRSVMVLRANVESVDGTRSRSVAILIAARRI